MKEKILEKTEQSMDKILEEGLNTNNLDHLYKLSKIRHLAKEDEGMYDNYDGRNPGHGSYGDYRGYDYGRRGYDMKYRGHDYIDRMYDNYGRYMENRNRYGASEETDKSFHYMVKALEDFIMVLEEEADTPQQKQQLRQALQSAMR